MKTSLSQKLIVGTMFITSLAFAQGGSTGASGGGTWIKLADGSNVLSDEFRKREVMPNEDQLGKRVYLDKDFSPEFFAAFKNALKIMASYAVYANNGAENNPLYGIAINDQVEYRMVKSIPPFCAKDDLIPSENLPAGSQGEVDASCRYGNYIFIVEDELKNVRNLDEISLMIIHELFHMTDKIGGSPIVHTLIGDVMSGLKIALKYDHLQKAGERPILSAQSQAGKPSDVDLLELMKTTLRQNWFFHGQSALNDYKVSPQGGGLVHAQANISPDVYVGVGSIVSDRAQIGAHSELIDAGTLCFNSCKIGDRVRINQVESKYVSQTTIGNDVTLNSVSFPKLDSISIGNGSELKNTKLRYDIDERLIAGHLVDFRVGENVQLVGLGDTYFHFHVLDRGLLTVAGEFAGLSVAGSLTSATGGLPLLLTTVGGFGGIAATMMRQRDIQLIVEDIRLDLTGKPALCESGKNYFRDNFGQRMKIDSIKKLQRRCMSEKRVKRIETKGSN